MLWEAKCATSIKLRTVRPWFFFYFEDCSKRGCYFRGNSRFHRHSGLEMGMTMSTTFPAWVKRAHSHWNQQSPNRDVVRGEIKAFSTFRSHWPCPPQSLMLPGLYHLQRDTFLGQCPKENVYLCEQRQVNTVKHYNTNHHKATSCAQTQLASTQTPSKQQDHICVSCINS